jgi:hypothetical protein
MLLTPPAPTHQRSTEQAHHNSHDDSGVELAEWPGGGANATDVTPSGPTGDATGGSTSGGATGGTTTGDAAATAAAAAAGGGGGGGNGAPLEPTLSSMSAADRARGPLARAWMRYVSVKVPRGKTRDHLGKC